MNSYISTLPSSKSIVYYKTLWDTSCKSRNLKYADILIMYPLFHDAMQTIPYAVLVSMCRYIGLAIPSLSCRSRLYRWADWIIKDNSVYTLIHSDD